MDCENQHVVCILFQSYLIQPCHVLLLQSIALQTEVSSCVKH